MKKLLAFIFAAALLAGCAGDRPEILPEGEGNLKVHFLDVGQGDCILVQFPDGRNMLVDAGKNDSAGVIVGYLKKAGVKKLDFVVGTHPHEDHIGSLDVVLKTFPAGEVFMPRVTTNTRTFRDVLETVKDRGLTITTARAGVSILKSGSISVDIVAPRGTQYESLNNYSAVIKITYGRVSFLLAGDAEEQSEAEMLAAGAAGLKADVLKVGHHGSRTSTSTPFLKAVAPRYAVISLAADNEYQYPHGVTLDKLKKTGARILRTDEKGTIVFTTDGEKITFATAR
ncbi:MAG: MBL fold metallo-hydrolase [Peptococcaceae bacterium]|nr:MBL fold metallo-hydrolase [Peptococcaceae bacterium]